MFFRISELPSLGSVTDMKVHGSWKLFPHSLCSNLSDHERCIRTEERRPEDFKMPQKHVEERNILTFISESLSRNRAHIRFPWHDGENTNRCNLEASHL